MEKRLQYGIIAVVAIAIIGIVIGTVLAGNPSTPSETEFFTIRTPTSTSLSVVDLADSLGYYKEAGIVIERTGSTTGGPQSIMTVAAGSNDIGISAFSAIVNAIGRGTKIKTVAPAIGTSPAEPDYKWLVLETSPIKTASDLKGKTIGVNTLGAHADFVTQAYLYQNGLTPSDVQLVVVPFENQEQVLRQGQVDVIAPNGNFLKKAEENGGVRALFSDGEVIGEQVKSGIVMSTDFIERHPDITAKFVNATVKAIEWDKQHRAESKVLLAKFLTETGGNPKLGELHNGWAIRSPPVINDADVQFWLDIMEKEGALKPGQLRPSDVYTNEFNPYS
ncbi:MULTISPECIES: ABC transporter substrate-binding protein [unclassified Methanoculleus]|jgi:ABC-type nitrate/sulfonate/bicarbonate transport system substrate-binding protein|uniref:ABC transporter substrate-binding protein n=1 Tax=unclassified Methanoculleus TaxID=2619537 RepID=UPI00319E589B